MACLKNALIVLCKDSSIKGVILSAADFSLKGALEKRLSLEKRFEIDRLDYVEFEKSMEAQIDDVVVSLQTLEFDISHIVDDARKLKKANSKILLMERTDRINYRILSRSLKDLNKELKLAEKAYQNKLLKIKRVSSAYAKMNTDNLEDFEVLGFKDQDEFLVYTDQIDPADERELVDLRLEKSIFNPDFRKFSVIDSIKEALKLS